MSLKKLVFVGAGPANLAAVMWLLYNDKKYDITLIDAGKGVDRDEKALLKGLGGAGTFSDNKNVFSKHKDQPIFDFIDDIEELDRYYDFYKTIIKDFHPDPSKISITQPAKLSDNLVKNGVKDSYAGGWGELAIKQSEVWHVGSYYGKIVLKNWHEFMVSKGVEMHFEENFVDIDGREVITDKGRYKFDKCFLALGKVGKKDLQKFYKNHGIESKVMDMNLGVRFETEYDTNENIKELVSTQYDFKFSKDLENRNIRTFCSCHGSAYVVGEDFDGTIRVNGHGFGLLRKEEWSGTSNFGLMINEKIDNDAFISEIIKKYPRGFVVRYNDDFRETIDVEVPTISEDEFKELYGKYANDILDFIDSLRKVLAFKKYRFYGPEIKEGASRVELRDDLSVVGLDSVRVSGDILGLRGICPSATSGMIAVRDL